MATKVSSRVIGAPRTAEPQIPLRFLAASGLIAVLAGFAVLGYAVISSGGAPREAAFAGGESVLYARFGTDADAVYQAPASGSKPRLLYQVPHAPEYGIVPSVAPDGGSFAYLVLPPETKAPAADSPAELWVSDATASGRQRLAAGFDLLVRPVWAPDGAAVVVRRSSGRAGPFELDRVAVSGGPATPLIESDDALFPVGFSTDGGALYYVALSPRGSNLYALRPGGEPALVSHLSDDLTRDWALSPSGGSLAFLTLKQTGQRVSSAVQVFDLASGAISTPGDGSADYVAPAWTADGRLTFGRVAASGGSGVLIAGNPLAAPTRGFDAPLAWSRSGSNIVVRSFDGASVSAPGRMTLALISAQGQRRTLASGEVTFIGWTYR